MCVNLRLTFPESDPEQRHVYSGAFKNGRMTGRGKMIWRNGSTYYGHWKDNSRYWSEV
jgi:hypothetical protein